MITWMLFIITNAHAANSINGWVIRENNALVANAKVLPYQFINTQARVVDGYFSVDESQASGWYLFDVHTPGQPDRTVGPVFLSDQNRSVVLPTNGSAPFYGSPSDAPLPGFTEAGINYCSYFDFEDANSSTVTIEGYVVGNNNQPVKDATVYPYRFLGSEAITDGQGYFSIPSSEASGWTMFDIVVPPSGFTKNIRPIYIPENANTLNLPVDARSASFGGLPVPCEGAGVGGLITLPVGGSDGHAPPKLYLPKTYDCSRAWPLVLAIHGVNGNGEQIAKDYFKLFSRADQRDFLVLAPTGVKNKTGAPAWNAIPQCCADDKSRDDVGYIQSLIKWVRDHYKIESQKIFSMGLSNGACMSYRLACEKNSVFSGIVAVSGMGYSNPNSDCRPTHPVRVLTTASTEDSAFYGGGVSTSNWWNQANSCKSKETPSGRKDFTGVPGEETSITRGINCAAGGKNELWTLNKDGHVPGFNSVALDNMLDFLMK